MTNSLAIGDREIGALRRRRDTQWGVVLVFSFLLRVLPNLRYSVVFFVLSHPAPLWLMRRVTASIRSIQPIPVFGSVAVPLIDRAVRETLNRPHDFNAAEEMAPKLPAGEVILAIDWDRRHTEEKSKIASAMLFSPEADDARIRRITTERARSVLRPARRLRAINLATELCERTALDVAEQHFGVVYEGNDGDLREVIRKLAAQVFQAPVAGSYNETYARIAADRMLTLILTQTRAAAARLDGTSTMTPSMTIMERLICLANEHNSPNWVTLNWVARNLMTLVVFGTATTARAMSQALWRIFRLDGARDSAAAASFDYQRLLDSNLPEGDHRSEALDCARRKLRAVVFEAMRWHPMLSMLGFRTAVRTGTLATGAPQQTPIDANVRVLPMLLAALHDPAPDAFPNPDKFDASRCPVGCYIHFGAGPHECPGRRVSEVQFEELLHAVMQRREIADGDEAISKALSYDGPAVVDLRIVPGDPAWTDS